MLFDRRFLRIATICLASAFLETGRLAAQAPAAPGQAETLDVQLMREAGQLFDAGQYSEAAMKYEELVDKYPQVGSVPQANFYAGRAHYLAGEYNEASKAFQRLIETKNLPPDDAGLLQLALSMAPQVLVQKASKMPPEDQTRKTTFEQAVKEFDVFLTKYPNSDEAETATYYKAVALSQLNQYDAAIQALKGNLAKFAQSPTIEDSQYLLALTLANVASISKQKATAPDPVADQQFDEADRYLRDILAKRQNIALMNDAQFQIGELLMARAGFMTAPEEKAKRIEMFGRALDAFHNVASKDQVIKAQKERIAYFTDLRNNALKGKDMNGFQKWKRVADKETEKLADLNQRQDEALTAKLRTGLIFFSESKWDETRVFYDQMEKLNLLEDANDRKQALYFVAMSYASQDLADKAVEHYKTFEAAAHNDPLGENLPLAMGTMFIRLKQPAKAIQYFDDGIKSYPKGKLLGPMVLAKARAQIDLKQYDQASTALQDTLAKSPAKDLAVDAQFYLATIDEETGKRPEAVKGFKEVRDHFPGTPQAEQAAFQIGQILSEIDPKAALPELQGFLKNFSKSQYLPLALFALGKAQAATNQTAEAQKTFLKVSTDFPKSAPAPFTYFERAKILSKAEKYDDCVAVMEEFIKNYPNSPSLFQAYDFIAQILTTQSKGPEAIAKYEEFVTRRPKDPSTPEALLKISTLWKAYTDLQGSYLALDEAKRTEWKKGIEKSTIAAERLISEFPESQEVAKALNTLMEVLRLQQGVRLKSEEDIEKYFEDLAQKFASKPGTRAKILFTLAAYTYGKDKKKAIEQMNKAYKPDLKFAPDDLDLYGQALTESGKLDVAFKIYEKLANDYKFAGDPKGAPREMQEARAIVLAGEGKILQASSDPAKKEQGAKLFAELEQDYPWSPKMLEVNYGIAVALHDKGKDEEARAHLKEVIKAQKASAELRAKSMLLIGDIYKSAGSIPEAIDNYIKISVFYTGVPKIAAEGLWRGAQLLEDQSTGKYPMPTPTPKPTPGQKTPAGAKPTVAPKAATAKH
ncbi:MAG TPA: tetratricopeptide repeat protein [Chthoniobacter sp.]|jgi:TolA-binding protein